MTAAIQQQLYQLGRENERLKRVNRALLAALQAYVDHYGDPLKVARAAIAQATGSPPSSDAVDPHAAHPGTPATREKTSS